MTTTLGIDAAWTATRLSDIALVSFTACNLRLIDICVFEGAAVPYSDDTSAIRIPGQSFSRRSGAGHDRIPTTIDRTPASDPASLAGRCQAACCC